MELAQKLVVSKRPKRSKSSPRSNDLYSDDDNNSVQAPARTPQGTPQGGNLKKKGERDDWCAPSTVENPYNRYFSGSESGLANRARIAAVKLRHHRKQKTDWSNTRLCIRFAIGMRCSRGQTCAHNHRSRHHAQQVPNDKEKVVQLDNIFHAIYH